MRRVLIGVLVLCVSSAVAACSPASGAGGSSSPTVETGSTDSSGTGLSGTGLSGTGLSSTDPSVPPSTVPVPVTETVSEAPTTVVTTPTDPTLIPPPPSTPEPAPTAGECPYLTTAQVRDANGQNVGAVETIATEPYPVCLFHRPDGTVLAAVRIVVADTPEAAAAAVNQHVPIDESFPATHPSGWTGGAMGSLQGVDGYPDGRSIYAVSKGTTAIIAVSNQNQSIKGRQMVTDVVDNLGL